MSIKTQTFTGGGGGAVTGGLEYKGTFNATTGAPSLANAEQGDYYKIATAGTIYGQTWDINDSLLINADMGGSIINSKIDKIDNTEPTNVLITTNNLSDLNNATTARTNLGLGNVATLTTGVANGNVIVADSTGLPAIDGSQLTGVTANDSTRLAKTQNLGDLTNVATARTNLGLGNVATLSTGVSNGNVIVADGTGLPAIDGSQLTGVTGTDSTKLAIANNLSDLNNATTARTNLGLGNVATLTTGVSNGNVIVADGTGLPAIDGSQLTGVTANDSTRLAKTQNLGDLTNVATARTNLGLGNVATLTTGVANGNVIVADSTGLPAIDGSQLTGVTGTDSTKLAIANNLSDLNNAGTARTNLGLGNVATLTTGVSNGNVIVADGTGLPAIDGSQLTGITATDSTKLAIANNLSDLNNATTARTNLGLGNVATLTTGVANGNVIVADSTGLPAIDGSQLTGITATDSTKLAIANNLSDLNNATTARTNLGLGTAAILNAGTGGSNLVQLNGSSQLPAVDGSNLTNVGKFIDYTTLSSNSNIFKNRGYNITANSLTLTLPARSTLIDGDSIAFTSAASYSVTIQLNSADTSTSNIFYNVGSATNASSHTITLNKQEIFIRYNGSSFLITSETKGGIADVVSDTSPQLGGSLDVNGQDIVSVSNGDIEVAPDGNGSFIIKGNATSGSGRIVLNCEQNSHGITLKGPPHSAAASYTLTLPNDDGDAGEVLKTDGSGNLDWVAQSGGSSAPTVTSASPGSNYTISTHADNEEIYLLTPSTNVSVLLPSTSSCGSGYKYQIKNLGAYTITIDPDGSEYIDHSSQTTFDIVQYESVTLVTNGSNWFII